jgi:hypothetical protein
LPGDERFKVAQSRVELGIRRFRVIGGFWIPRSRTSRQTGEVVDVNAVYGPDALKIVLRYPAI